MYLRSFIATPCPWARVVLPARLWTTCFMIWAEGWRRPVDWGHEILVMFLVLLQEGCFVLLASIIETASFWVWVAAGAVWCCVFGLCGSRHNFQCADEAKDGRWTHERCSQSFSAKTREALTWISCQNSSPRNLQTTETCGFLLNGLTWQWLRSAEAGTMTLSKAFEILEAEGKFYELGAGWASIYTIF